MLSSTKLLKRIQPKFLMKKPAISVKSLTVTQCRAMTATVNRFKYGSYGNAGQNQNRRNRMYPLAALSLLSIVGGWEMLKKKLAAVSECCGIIGYIGQENIAGRLVLDGIQILQYRGYDS